MSLKRREWDSNPRALADKRFSRPPRYDHFDISPSVAVFHAAKIILAKTSPPVNIFFKFFRHFCKFNFSHRFFASLFLVFPLLHVPLTSILWIKWYTHLEVYIVRLQIGFLLYFEKLE